MRDRFTPPASNLPETGPGVVVGETVDVGAGVLVGGRLVDVGGIGVEVSGMGVAAGLQATNAAINASSNNWVNFDGWHMRLLS
jgi:hypothetical protein